MAEVLVHAEVRVWGETVGAVAELDSGRILFEYAEPFWRRGLELSPIHLPTTRRGPIHFDELRRQPAFQGLPGVLADALPDAFGNQVIRAWFAARGQEERALSPVQRLLYVGERAIGALTFHPAEDLPVRPAELESLELAALVRDARAIVEGRPDVTIPEIYRIGASAGGMRPKALVSFEPESQEIRSANSPAKPGDRACILKFDGVGDGASADTLGRPQPFNRIEAAYTRMASAAGLDTCATTLLEHDGYAHLLVERFDLGAAGRLHQHTFGGLVHVDYNDPGASSYEEYLRAVLRLGMPYAGVEEGYRRMVFNVLAVNQDDHVKNLSFQVGPDGKWRLSPAYDLTFARGNGWTARHQMRVQDKTSGLRERDLLAVGNLFDLNDPAKVLDRARAALARWEEFAATADVPGAVVKQVRGELDRRSAESVRSRYLATSGDEGQLAGIAQVEARAAGAGVAEPVLEPQR